MLEFPWGCQRPMSARSVQLASMTKALLPLLLPNATPASPGLCAKGPPRCPYLQALLLSTLHSCGKHRLPVGAGESMANKASGGEHPASPCQLY